MPLYFFDIDDGDQTTVDDEGVDHFDAETARFEGIATLAQIVKDKLPDGDVRDFKMNIRDETGKVIFKATITLSSSWVE